MNNAIETLLLSLRNFQYIELFVYIFIIIFIVYGWRKGFLLQFFYLMTLLISVALSFRYSYQVGSYISSWFNSNIQLSEIFGGVLIFITILTISSFFQNFITNNQKQRDVGNKLLGASFSLLVSNLILTLLFTITSILTGTGYSSSNFSNWGSFGIVIMMIIMFIGGCAGSTTGGIKIFRLQILFLFVGNQIKKLIYPNSIFIVNYNNIRYKNLKIIPKIKLVLKL